MRGAGDPPLYDDGFEASPLRRALNTSWPLFRAFGVDVRVHWTIVVVPLALCSMFAQYSGLGVLEAVGVGLAFTLALYTCIWTHEMAHIVTARRFGVASERISLNALGGLAHLDAGAPTPRAEMIIALAGPASHLVWLAVLGPIYLVLDRIDPTSAWVWGLGTVCHLQIALMLFNLLPFFPLDGGRTLRGFLATRMHANKASLWTAYTGYGGAVLLLIIGMGTLIRPDGDAVSNLRFDAGILILIAFNNVMACQRLMTEARFTDGPYEPVEEWKKGGAHEEPWRDGMAEAAKVSRAEARAERRAATAAADERERREQLHSRIDELLDRINEVGGVENLSPSERSELSEASELLRKETTSG